MNCLKLVFPSESLHKHMQHSLSLYIRSVQLAMMTVCTSNVSVSPTIPVAWKLSKLFLSLKRPLRSRTVTECCVDKLECLHCGSDWQRIPIMQREPDGAMVRSTARPNGCATHTSSFINFSNNSVPSRRSDWATDGRQVPWFDSRTFPSLLLWILQTKLSNKSRNFKITHR